MRDPFRPNSNKQLVREAQFGFAVIGMLVAILIYVAYYRLNGMGDELPQQIRDAPVAMQVFPDSPNYDRNTNQMIVKKRWTEEKSPIVTAPKRVMDESSNTFRSMQQAARKIEGSAAKVHSLASVGINEDPVGLVSNPAARKPDFKMPEPAKSDFKKPQRDVITSRAPERVAKLETPTPVPKRPATSPVKSFLQKLPRISKSKSVEAKSVSTFAPSNDFKPLKSKPSKPSTTGPFIAKPFTTNPATSRPIPPADKATFNPLSPRNAKPLRPKKTTLPSLGAAVPAEKPIVVKSVEEPIVEVPKDSPVVKRVSFIEQETWTVKKGDSFWSIAQTHYGDGRFFRALYEENRHNVAEFENLKEGAQVVLPPVDEMLAQHPDLCPSSAAGASNEKSTDSKPDQRLYETQPGDTLFSIARQRLGQASRYVELMELNKDRIQNNLTNESRLPAGIQILLPAR